MKNLFRLDLASQNKSNNTSPANSDYLTVIEERPEFLYIDTTNGDVIDSKAQTLGKYFQLSDKVQLIVKSDFAIEAANTILTILGINKSKQRGPIFKIPYADEENQSHELNISVTQLSSMNFNKQKGIGFVSCLLSLK